MAATVTFCGCPLTYEVRGAGEAVVFIQGVGIHACGWGKQVNEIAKHKRCLTFDNRGIGRSCPAGGPVTVEQMAKDTLALMDASGIESAHIVGHSFGGIVAQQIALSARRRVLSLSLLCTSGRGADAIRFSPRLIQLALRSRIGTRRMRRLALLKIVMPSSYIKAKGADALAEELGSIFGHDLADSPRIVEQQVRALIGFNALPRLRVLDSLPTLVLSASDDPIFPAGIGRVLAEAIQGARFVEVRDASHAVIIQRAAEINQMLLEHFASAAR